MFLHILHLWAYVITEREQKRSQQQTRPAPNHTSKGHTCHSGFKGISIFKTRSVHSTMTPDPTALMWHIVPPSYTLMSLSPMEVIKRAHAWSWHQQELHIMTVMFPMWLLCGSLAINEIHIIHCGFSCAKRTKTKLRGVSYGQGCCEGL